jgi:hypothetical protein
MNDVVQHTGATSVAAHTPQAPSAAAAKARKVAETLRKAHDVLLEPQRRWAQLDQDFPGWFKAHCAGRDMRFTAEHLAAGEYHRAARARAGEYLEAVPTSGLLSRVGGIFATAVEMHIDAVQSRLLLGLMIDGFPNARPHDPATYLETAVHEVTVRRYSPSAVAAARQDIMASCKFLPTVSEVLSVCEEAQKSLETYRKLLEQAVDTRHQIEDAITGASAMEEIAEPETLAALKEIVDATYRDDASLDTPLPASPLPARHGRKLDLDKPDRVGWV